VSRFEFFRSAHVHWPQGIRVQKVMWHSAMQWGWPAIRRGERLARWSEYIVLTVCFRRFGMCWHYYPKAIHS
jgi:hypothetical protein